MLTLPDWLTPDLLPTPLCDMLLSGTVGREHLLRTAAMVAETARQAAAGQAPTPRLTNLRAMLLAAAFEEDSLYGPTAQTLAPLLATGTSGVTPPDPAFAALLATLGQTFRIPESTAYYQRLLAAGDARRVDAYLENECKNRRHGLFWLHVALHRVVLTRDFERGEALTRLALPEACAALTDKLQADLALLAGRPGHALSLYEASLAKAPRPLGRFRAALAAWQAGDTGAAKAHFTAVLAAMPEHVSAALALYDLHTGRDTATAPTPADADVAIALYTYNKVRDIDATLASLFATDIGRARVTVLDNASTDATPEVLAAWVERVGGERLSVIRLPVNIGAPAARNWLATVPEIARAAFVAYLDDDVDLPRDWLGRLFAARSAYPEAGVWGCRVVDAANPAVAQGVGSLLVPAADRQGHPTALPWLSDAQATSFDFGAFTHLRPCLSVMGCCHLFQGDRLRAAGGFDIRYSPSQYDDVDHDLRLVLAGRAPVYQGHLAVAHRRPAPVFAPPRPEQQAGGEANRQKLLAKLADRFPQLGAVQRQQACADLTAKWRTLCGMES